MSDHLDTKRFDRIRLMPIDEFNERRLFESGSKYWRSQIFYKKGD